MDEITRAREFRENSGKPCIGLHEMYYSDDVDELLAAYRREGWISVTERLPEMNTPVWVTDGVLLTVCERTEGEDGWLWARVVAYNYWHPMHSELDDDYSSITHWMPLPPAPQEQP